MFRGWFKTVDPEAENLHIINNISNFNSIFKTLLSDWKSSSLKNVDHLKNIASIQVIEDLAKTLKKLKKLDPTKLISQSAEQSGEADQGAGEFWLLLDDLTRRFKRIDIG